MQSLKYFWHCKYLSTGTIYRCLKVPKKEAIRQTEVESLLQWFGILKGLAQCFLRNRCKICIKNARIYCQTPLLNADKVHLDGGIQIQSPKPVGQLTLVLYVKCAAPVSLIVAATKRPAFILICLLHHFMRSRADKVKIKIFMTKALLAVRVAHYSAEVVYLVSRDWNIEQLRPLINIMPTRFLW